MAITNSLFAQTTIAHSETLNIVEYYSKYGLACSDNDKYVVTYSTESSMLGRQSFIVHNMHTGAKKVFGLTVYSNLAYVINDIVLKNGICYFCGHTYDYAHNNVYYPGIGWTNEGESKGIVGYFDINDVFSGSGRYYWITIDETEELTHLAIDENELVYAVGHPQYCPLDENNMESSSCIVCLERSPYTINQWYYDVLSTNNNGEMLLDVTAGSDGIYTVSRFQNDHYRIGVRHTKNGPFRYIEPHGQIDCLYIFNTQNMGISELNESITWRDNYCPIFIDNHTIGHICCSADNGHSGLMIYKLNLTGSNTVSLANAQYIYREQYSNLLDLKENYYIDNNQHSINYVCLLTENQTSNMSIISYANWHETTSYYARYLHLPLNDIAIADIVPYNSGNFLFSFAHNGNNSQTIENHQDLKYFQAPSSTCFPNNAMSFHQPLETVDPSIGDTLHTVCLNKYKYAISSNYTSTTIHATINCRLP